MSKIMLAVRRSRRSRPISIALACVAVYAASVMLFNRDPGFREDTLTTAPAASAPIKLYIDELAFDPVRQAISVRIDVGSEFTTRVARYGGSLDRDVQLSIDDGDSEQVVELRRDEPAAPRLLSLDVRGAVANYPFDRYRADITISARERSPRGEITAVPIAATVWEGIPGWVTGMNALPAPPTNSVLGVGLTMRRPLLVMAFAIVLYGLMIVLAACSLCIGGLVFIGRRKVESTIVGALAAMVFSVAALRNVLPGGPPISVTADVLIFLWAEIAVIAGLSLLVTAWVRRGPGV